MLNRSPDTLELTLKNEQAGALTFSTTKAMKLICDGVIGVNSKLYDRRDRMLGSMYSRTSTVHRDRKFQVVNSTGKHTHFQAMATAVQKATTSEDSSWMKAGLKISLYYLLLKPAKFVRIKHLINENDTI